MLPSEGNRIYDFFRGLDDSYKPSYAFSDDLGQTWSTGNVVIAVPATDRHRPYVRYAADDRETIHLFYTEGHPRDFDNSVYHVFYKNGWLHASDGKQIARLNQGLSQPGQGTRIFQGDADHVAWVVDAALDAKGLPRVVYSVQVASARLPPGQGGTDIRYRFARWDGREWRDHALAYAGERLYAGEDDYSGLGALDPDDPDVVFISTSADPLNGEPLVSAADARRHWEIFRGVTRDRGDSWTWTPITQDSTADNLRPIVPRGDERRSILLWLRGRYSSYTSYELDVMALIGERRDVSIQRGGH